MTDNFQVTIKIQSFKKYSFSYILKMIFVDIFYEKIRYNTKKFVERTT